MIFLLKFKLKNNNEGIIKIDIAKKLKANRPILFDICIISVAQENYMPINSKEIL